MAHLRGHVSTDAVRWVRRRVPQEHRVRVQGLRCPSARYLAIESAARDSGALLEQFLRTGLVKPSELAAWLRTAELQLQDVSGMLYEPWRNRARLSRRTDINYLAFAVKPDQA